MALFEPTETQQPSKTPGDEPRVRGTIIVGFQQASERVFGPAGLDRVAARLPDASRAATTGGNALNLEWFPEQYVLDWYHAVWDGPAERDKKSFFAFLDRMMDMGFGRVRRALLALADPKVLVDRVETLWRHDHSHGTLTAEMVPGGARLRLADHPYADDPLASMAIAEIYRYCAALCRVKNATETHRREATALVVQLRWTRG